MPKILESEAHDAYDYLRVQDDFPDMRCWLCGVDMRTQMRRPAWWNAPWLLHRSHAVSSPRREDRRAIVLLCPACHGLHHGTIYPQLRHIPKPTTAELLWLKLTIDGVWYDRPWLQRHFCGKLPSARRPRSIFSEIVLVR
jgi:hypothetical protein